MKKTLLLLFALMASLTGAWAQTELVPTEIAQVGTSPELIEGSLAKLHDGNNKTEGENKLTTGDFPLTIYYDLEETKNVGTIKMYWPRCTASAYSIYVTDTKPNEENSASWGAAVASETNYTFDDNLVKEKVYTTNAKGRYVIFQFTAKSSWASDYGLMLNEIEIFQYEELHLTSITSNVLFLEVGTPTSVEFSLKDQFGDDFTGNVEYTVTNGTYNESTHKITATAGGEVIVTATDDNSNEASVSFHGVAVAPPAAKTGSSNLEIYTNTSGEPTWTAEAGSVLGNELTIGGTKVKAVNLKQLNIAPATTGAIKNYNHASVAIFPVSNIATGAAVVNPGNKYKNFQDYMTGGLPAGKWTVVDYEFSSDAEDNVSGFRVHNDGASNVDVLIANVVLYYKEPGSFDYDTSADGKTVTVTGNVTESNISTINTFTAPKLDLTGVTSWTATSAIESSNPNQIIVVGCTYTGTDANPGVITPAINVANTKNVVAYTGYYFALTPIEITDNNTYQPWDGSINTNYGGNGYTITRSFDTSKYVTAYFPTTVTNVTVSNGSIYALDSENSTTSEVKFNKVDVIGGGTPFVVHTTATTTITATGSNDLNMGENAGNTAQIEFASGAAKFKGNLIAKPGIGDEYGLYNATESVSLGQIGTGATIGAFRAYFTGLAALTPARFFDGETTKIGTIKANGEVKVGEVYNLNGQRVMNPTKGLYIVNGKKVAIK